MDFERYYEPTSEDLRDRAESFRYAVRFYSSPGELAAIWEGSAASHVAALDKARNEIPADIAAFPATTQLLIG